MPRSLRKGGFTFLEIMLVVVIIGVLAAIVAVKFGNRRAVADVNATRVTIANTETAIDLFNVDHGRLPQRLVDLVNPPLHPTGGAQEFYMEVPPTDAWGQELVYRVPPEHFGRVYDIYSVGPNGEDDGGGADDVIPVRYARAGQTEL